MKQQHTKSTLYQGTFKAELLPNKQAMHEQQQEQEKALYKEAITIAILSISFLFLMVRLLNF